MKLSNSIYTKQYSADERLYYTKLISSEPDLVVRGFFICIFFAFLHKQFICVLNLSAIRALAMVRPSDSLFHTGAMQAGMGIWISS